LNKDINVDRRMKMTDATYAPAASAPSSPRRSAGKTVAELGQEYDALSTEFLLLSREHTELVGKAETLWKRMTAEHATLQKAALDVWEQMKALKVRKHVVMRDINDTISTPSTPTGKKKKPKKKKPGAPSMLTRPRSGSNVSTY
jgi:hypothetical protein